MNRSVRRILACCMVASALACGSDDSGDEAKVTFTKDIHPILQMKCGKAGCHDTPNSFLPGHGAADANAAYTEATRTWSGGEPVYDLILLRVASDNPSEIMPPTYGGCSGSLGAPGCITQAEYDLIQKWVDEGHPK